MVKSQAVDLRSGSPWGGNAFDPLRFAFISRDVEPSTGSSRVSDLTLDLEASKVEEEPRRREELASSEEHTDFRRMSREQKKYQR